jgi:TDG/mug DNA glycosylase family protein
MNHGETTMDPILNDETEILIVGTYPSQISRRLDQYYGNPNNHFWKLMSHLLDVDLQEMDYNARIETLLQHRIGLWDTIGSCDITGSSDSSIRNEACNDFSHLGHIRKIICNGKKAYDCIGWCSLPENISRENIVQVPSSSPARAMRFEEKLAEWKEALCLQMNR